MHAIKTTYAGVNFRSRLEARWAAFFDLIGWQWDYEPIDLAGYIPDFVLDGSVLAEVKPLLWSKNREPEAIAVANKIDASGWDGPSALLGARFVHQDCTIGLCRMPHQPGDDWDGMWMDAKNRCNIAEYTIACSREDLDRCWREAGNRVQWRP